jgi:uncharacterized protein (DUF1684 family)
MDLIESHQHWQAARHDELAAPDSWLGLIGLFWLEPGLNTVGSAEGSTVQLPAGTPHLGDLRWQGDKLFWLPEEGAEIELQTDLNGQATTVDYKNWSFFVVDRKNRLAVRLRDREWAQKKPFNGLTYFAYDPAWCIEAEWQSLTPPVAMEVPNVTGELKTVLVDHKAVFEVAGQKLELLPMSVSDSEIFFVFRDRSSGKETYGAGRFLKAAVSPQECFLRGAVDGKISLNFNFAYSPPCAFTPFAMCPLPPTENWLPFAVAAGEKKPGKFD